MKITVFTLPDCEPCRLVKADLDSIGVEYEDVPARQNRDRWEEAIGKFPKGRKVGLPCTVIEGGDQVSLITGWYPGYKDAVNKRIGDG